MMNRLKKHMKIISESMKNKIILYMLVLNIIPLIIALIVIALLMPGIGTNSYRKSADTSLEKTSQLINAEIMNYINNSNYVIRNQYLISGMRWESKEDLKGMMSLYNDLELLLGAYNNVNGESQFMIYTNNKNLLSGKYVEPIENMKDEEFKNKVINQSDTSVAFYPKIEEVQGNKSIVFYRNIKIFKEPLGILKTRIPLNLIIKYLELVDFEERYVLAYIDGQGKVVYKTTNNDDIQLEELSELNDFSTDYLTIEKTLIDEHKIILAVPLKDINRDKIKMIVQVMSILVIVIVTVLVVTYIASNNITKNLYKFIQKLETNEDIDIIFDGIEIEKLKNKFLQLLEKNNQANKDMYEIKLKNTKLELELLQAKINPHLLYNSLSAIRWDAIEREDIKTVQLVEALTKYYRNSLNKGNNVLKVSAEIDMLKQYLSINEISHGWNIQLIINISPEVMECYTIKHILQPIVENAVLHNLSDQTRSLTITINGYLSQEDVVIEIIDNGCGISKDKVDAILSMNYKAKVGGYGIRNLMQRINLSYGEPYGLDFESEVGKGTKFTLRIALFGQGELSIKNTGIL